MRALVWTSFLALAGLCLPLPAAYCTPPTARCTLPPTARCTLPPTARCTPPTARCTLHAAHCTLHAARCRLLPRPAHCTAHTRRTAPVGRTSAFARSWLHIDGQCQCRRHDHGHGHGHAPPGPGFPGMPDIPAAAPAFVAVVCARWKTFLRCAALLRRARHCSRLRVQNQR